MRAETLLFLHVLVAMTMVGGLLATAVLASTSASLLAVRSAVLAAAAAFVTIVLGETTRAREDLAGTWLDVASALAYAGLLLPAIALAVLASLAVSRPRLARWTSALAIAMLAVSLAVAFLMAAKPR